VFGEARLDELAVCSGLVGCHPTLDEPYEAARLTGLSIVASLSESSATWIA
jgi:hypothetical protein